MFLESSCACALFLLPTAQEPLNARSFVPPDPHAEVYVDFEWLRESGLLDRVQRTLAGNLLMMVEEEVGFSLAEIDEMWAYPSIANGDAHAHRQVVIFEGTPELLTPSGRVGTRTDQVGKYDVVFWEDTWEVDDPGVWVAPVEGTLVYGCRDCVLPVLRGQQQPGLMPANLRSLAAGRGVVFHYVEELGEADGKSLLGPFVGQEMEMPKFLMTRLCQAGSADPELAELQLELLMRWPVDSAGPAAMKQQLTDRIASLREHPRFGALRSLLDALDLTVKGQELQVRLQMGDARQASNMIGGLFPLMMVSRPIEQPAEEGDQARDPEPPAAEAGRRGGGGR